MDREQEVIHHQMEATRADLTNKLSALENQVGGTVQAATDAVETTKDVVNETVESVKETVENVTEKFHDTVEGVTDSVQHAVEGVRESVEETVKTVTEAFNLKLQCERHPWVVFGGAVGVGFLGGLLLGRSSRQANFTSKGGSAFLPDYSSGGETRTAAAPTQPRAEQKSDTGTGTGAAVSSWFWDQLGGLRGLALGAVMGVVKDLVTQAVPAAVKERVTEEVDKITKGLGGEPLKGSLLGQNDNDQGNDQGHSQFSSTPGNGGRAETGGRSGQPALATSRR